MQTFLVSSSFAKSARCLDRQRLGKQRVEAYQILLCLLNVSSTSWKNHPAVKMWRGHEGALYCYTQEVCDEWARRGYSNLKMKTNLITLWNRFGSYLITHSDLPPWLGNRKFHASHRSNLLRKDKKYYKKFAWKEKANLEYVWPVRQRLGEKK